MRNPAPQIRGLALWRQTAPICSVAGVSPDGVDEFANWKSGYSIPASDSDHSVIHLT
jgi:hypothetical protein